MGTPLEPNHVTSLALACGGVMGLCMAMGTRPWMLVGAFFLHVSFVLDNCDGELARMKKMRTPFGSWYDKIADVTVDLFLWGGLYAASWTSPGAVWLFAAAAAGSALNFGMVVAERKTGCSTSVHVVSYVREHRRDSLKHSVLDFLTHNGDTAVFVWAFAIVGDPRLFLAAGALFINALWLIRLVANFRHVAKPVALALKPVALRLAQVTALCAGLWLLGISFRGTSWAELSALFAAGGLGLLAAFFVYPFACVFHALGHYRLFEPATRKRMRFSSLYSAHFTGDALNKITPFIDVGGEPVKLFLVHRLGLAPLEESLAAVCVSRLLFVASEIVFILLGMGILVVFHPSLPILAVAALGILFSAVLIVMLYFAQTRFLEGLIPEVARRMKTTLAAGRSAEIARAAADTLKRACRERFGDLVISGLWNLIGWIAAFLEVYIILRVMGVPVTLAQAFLIQSLFQALQTATFFIPGNVGAQEGGLAYLLQHLHFSTAHGLALSLVKRGRQIAWALAAPALYMLLVDSRRAASRAAARPD